MTSDMKPRVVFAILTMIAPLLSGCPISKLPKTLGETQTSYSYVPLDPLPVTSKPGLNCIGPTSKYKGVLDSLPDEAVRMAVGNVDASGAVTYGPVKVGASGESYQVILDYISVDTANVPVYIERRVVRISQGDNPSLKVGGLVSVFDNSIKSSDTSYKVRRDPASEAYLRPMISQPTPAGDSVVIPVYVGVGLRLTASITVTKGTVHLSSLGAIAADAQAGKLTGSLVVQTLGVTGKSIATTLPLPSELNQTTVQNAILALGSIKAVLYDQQNTQIEPRVVGIYNPIGGGQQVVNGIISTLVSDPIRWNRPCITP
jgi:hypothetical protein